jgi:hypothetical protein
MFYEVKIYLSTPIAFQTKKRIYPLHFDGLLTALSVYRNGITDNPLPQEAALIELPLNRAGGEKWVWKASCMEIDQSRSRIARDVWTSHTNWAEIVSFKKKLDPGSGIFRAKTGLLMLLVTPFIKFYIDTDDINGVITLLNDLTNVGSRVSAGYGEVKNIEIRKIKQDYSLVDERGYVARHIPVSEIEKPDPRWIVDYAGYRSPYYFYPFFDLCYVPPVERYWPHKRPRDIIQELLTVRKGAASND